MKWSNIHVLGIPELNEKQNEPEHIFEEITSESFQIWWENISLQTQDLSEFQRKPHLSTS